MPAGAVFHKAHHAAQNRQRQAALGSRPAGLGEPAAGQHQHPDCAQQFQHSTDAPGHAHKLCKIQPETRRYHQQHAGQCRQDACRFFGLLQVLCVSGAVPANEHGRQHRRAQCGIAHPDRPHHTQAAHRVGAQQQVCRAGNAQQNRKGKTQQNQCIHQRSSIGLYFCRTPRYL